jgi:integrase
LLLRFFFLYRRQDKISNSTLNVEEPEKYMGTILFPALRGKSIVLLEPQDFLAVVKPMEEKAVTSHKLLNLCSQVMEYARLRWLIKYNPAFGLSKAIKPIQSEHRAAIIKPEEFGRLLRAIDTCTAHPFIVFYLKILPYVFTRPGELRLAKWEEVDFSSNLWRVPAERMKMRQEHVVPISRQARKLLSGLNKLSGHEDYLFPKIRQGKDSPVISDGSALLALRKLGFEKADHCLHGFRSTASSILNELGYRGDVVEASLAHKEGNAVRAAYNRAEYLPERHRMMQEWADYLDELREAKD